MTKLLYVFSIISIIFFITNVNAQAPQECEESQTILKISARTNAHAEVYNGINYQYKICFNHYFDRDYNAPNSHEPNQQGDNIVLKLSSQTNAHVESPNQNNYNVPVYFGDLRCEVVPDCTQFRGNGGRASTQIATLSDITNAHISLRNDYQNKLCCYSLSAGNRNPQFCGNNVIDPGEECDDGNNQDGDGCSADCQIEGGGDFCSAYDPYFVYEGNGCPEGEECEVATCTQYNFINAPQDYDEEQFRQTACTFDCLGVGQDPEAHGVDPSDVIRSGCAWESQNARGCYFWYDTRQDNRCSIEEINSAACNPETETRIITIRVNPPGEQCSSACPNGQETCEREVPCGTVLQLPFFDKTNFAISLLLIFLIYLMLKLDLPSCVATIKKRK